MGIICTLVQKTPLLRIFFSSLYAPFAVSSGRKGGTTNLRRGIHYRVKAVHVTQRSAYVDCLNLLCSRIFLRQGYRYGRVVQRPSNATATAALLCAPDHRSRGAF